METAVDDRVSDLYCRCVSPLSLSRDACFCFFFLLTVLAPSSVWHLVLFVLAIVTHRQNRRHQKTRYRPDEYSMQNGTAETLLPIQERPVVNGYSAF